LGVALAALIIYAFIYWRDSVALKNITVGAVGIALLTFILTQAATMVLGKNVMRVVQFRNTLIHVAIGIAMALLGWLIARLHLHVFDKMFLSRGSLKEFRRACE
jgi:hypothetical protein